MSGKRQATSDLNHDNWDRDEEPEERGTFITATEDELKNRVIKKAKRKLGSTPASGTGSVFSGFSGFGKPAAPAATSTASPFSFLSKIPAASASSAGGIVSSSSSAASTTSATFSFGLAAATTSTAGSSESPTTSKSQPPVSFTGTTSKSSSDTPITSKNTFVALAANSTTEAPKTITSNFSFGSKTTSPANDSNAQKKSDDYYAKLKGLNQAVSQWIKTHVDKNPLCILTPIFKDYENYIKELDDEKSKVTETTAEKKSSTTTTAVASSTETFKAIIPTTTATSTFTFASSSVASSSSNAAGVSTKTNGFSFGYKKPDETQNSTKTETKTDVAATPTFSFGLKPATASTTGTSFSFGNSAAATTEANTAPKPFSFNPGGIPFSFANIKPPEASKATETTNDDEDEEPPKNEFKQVVEEDAIYSKKCKVFVKKDGNFVDKGVGTLYLKKIESNDKIQLLVRADTNLGNILVNLILSSGIPSQRMGKNNVMLVCLPTPDMEKPTSMLLRVKTGEEADELLENIEKYKK